jgi:hypothetical protein
MHARTTRKERFEATREMIEDIGKDLTMREITRHLYHVWRYECAVNMVRKGRRLIENHADILNEDIEVFKMRKGMKHMNL